MVGLYLNVSPSVFTFIKESLDHKRPAESRQLLDLAGCCKLGFLNQETNSLIINFGCLPWFFQDLQVGKHVPNS